jgi:hypothetical protein
MKAAIDRPRSLVRGRRLPEVTREEIAITERILQSIDLNNQVLASVSQWVLVWQNVRELSFRMEASSKAAQEAVVRPFKRLLIESIHVGKRLVELVDSLRIPAEQMTYATGCSRGSVVACVALLQDILEGQFGKSVSLDLVKEVWAEFSREPDAVV